MENEKLLKSDFLLKALDKEDSTFYRLSTLGELTRGNLTFTVLGGIDK